MQVVDFNLSTIAAPEKKPEEIDFNLSTLATQPEEEETSTFSDIAQGVGAGAVGLVQGVAETGAALTDFAFDTDTSQSVTKGFEATKDYLGLTPETTAGKTAEALTTFGAALIPVIGWVGRASQVARGASVLPTRSVLKAGADRFGKSKTGKALLGGNSPFTVRAKLAATTSLAGGAAEMLVAPDGTHTLSDAFDILPDALETEVDSGLQGRDEAARRLRNKLRMGVEGTALGATFEAAFPVLGVTTKAISMTPGVPATARAVSGGLDYLGRKLSGSFNGKVGQYFTSTGATRKDVFEDLRTIENVTDQQADTAARLLHSFDREIKKSVGAMRLLGRGKDGIQKGYDDFLQFMEGDKDALNAYGKGVVGAATKARTQIDELRDMAITELEASVRSGAADKDLAEAAIAEIKHNKASYLRRSFEGVFDDDTVSIKDVMKKPAYKKAVSEISRRIQSANPEELAEQAEARGVGPGVIANEMAEVEVRKHFVRSAADEGFDTPEAAELIQKAATKGSRVVAEKPLHVLSEGLFKKRSQYLDKSPALRELMREIRDPQELYIRTISDLSKFVTTSRMYRRLSATDKVIFDDARDLINAGQRPMIVSGENVTPAMAEQLKKFGYTQLGKVRTGESASNSIFAGDYGAISGDYVLTELKSALSVPPRTSNIGTEMLAVALQAKGLSQMSKTVLNAIAQVRNFAGGTFMVGANGNLPRTAEIGSAFDAVYKKINGLSDTEKDQFFRMVGDLGLVDENLAVNEMKLLLQETEGLKSGSAGGKINALVNKVPGVKALQQIYSDTDTFWKTVGFLGEKAKYSAAFRKAGLDPDNLGVITQDLVASGIAPRSSDLMARHGFINVFASDIVKETMPIYSRVPEVIRAIRRIPIAGNFVAFPAEVLRNTTNIVQRGVRELGFKASDDLIKKIGPENAKQLERQIRAIGMNRLASYTTSAFVIPAAISRASYAATDVSEKEVDDMRPLLPYYMEGSQLMSLAKPKEGKWEHADLSYMLPYDFAYAPARRAMQVYTQKGELGAGEAEQITASLWSAFSSFMEPFASESLIAERVQDALPSEYFGRGGETATGSPIWSDVNDTGTKIEKSFRHILGGFTPGIVEMLARPTAQKIEPGRITSAVTGSPTRTGREYNIHEEAFSAATGVRKLELDASKSLSFRGYEFTELRSQALGDFARIAKSNDSTEEDVLNAYLAANQDAFRAQRQMYGFVKAAEAAGLEPREIIIALKRDSNLGTQELGLLLQGRFRPVAISDKVLRDVFMETAVKEEPRTISMLPAQSLGQIYSELAGASLESDSPFQEPTQQVDFDLSSLSSAGAEQNTGVITPSVSPTPPVQQVDFDLSSLSSSTSPQTRQALAGLNPGTQLIAARNP